MIKQNTSYILRAASNKMGEREYLIATAYLSNMELHNLNSLLEEKGYGKLYVRKVSDAIWKYIFMNSIALKDADALFSDILKI